MTVRFTITAVVEVGFVSEPTLPETVTHTREHLQRAVQETLDQFSLRTINALNATVDIEATRVTVEGGGA